MRTTRYTASIAALLAIFGLAAHAEPPVALTVYHRFTVNAGPAWTSASVHLHSGAWRVGAPDGPLASDAQWQAVLGALKSLQIGARCTGTTVGATHYACRLDLLHPAVDDGVSANQLQQGWKSTSGNTLVNFVTGVFEATSEPQATRMSRTHTTAAGKPGVAQGFLGLTAPAAFCMRAASAAGKTLTFELRTGASELGAAPPASADGLVILSAESTSADQGLCAASASDIEAPKIPPGRLMPSALVTVNRSASTTALSPVSSWNTSSSTMPDNSSE